MSLMNSTFDQRRVSSGPHQLLTTVEHRLAIYTSSQISRRIMQTTKRTEPHSLLEQAPPGGQEHIIWHKGPDSAALDDLICIGC